MRTPRRAYKRPAMSPEKLEAMRAFNAQQEWRGQCRVCKATWTGLRKDMPSKCPNCGHGT